MFQNFYVEVNVCNAVILPLPFGSTVAIKGGLLGPQCCVKWHPDKCHVINIIHFVLLVVLMLWPIGVYWQHSVICLLHASLKV